MNKAKWLLAVVAAGAAASAAAATLAAGPTASADPGTILKFDSMAPVTGPYVGTANPVRNLSGGGLPWIITRGMGELKRDGQLDIHVRGLVLAKAPPVPPSLQGINPVPDFEAVVSCQGISGQGTATITNVTTGLFAASPEGDSNIKSTVTLPSPCFAPIVFVSAADGSWFAATGG
jgi:hypothetical protein